MTYTHGYFAVCAGTQHVPSPRFFNGIFGKLMERLSRRKAIRAAASGRCALVVYKGNRPVFLFDGYGTSPLIRELEKRTNLKAQKITWGQR